ncbi:hypothetical protein DFJ73DRAFT_189078 [Zopfochytrium polystomum]|nr:hypothetical protein DFJ73DRAFT_189078 [Zopfochytrium polystomum]
MNSNFSVTMTSPYADSPDTYNSSPLDPETALDAFLHNFSQDDQMSLLSGDVMDGSVFNIGMTGDSSSATEEQFYTGTFAGSSNRSSSPSTDSTLSVTKDTIFDQMGDATMMESMNAEMLGMEGSGLSKLPAVGLIRDSSDSITAPQNAVTSTTTPDSGVVLKRKRGRPAGKRDPTKDKKPAPAVAAATNAAALRKSGKAGMGTPSSAGGAPFLSNVAPLQAAPAPINAPVPALPLQAETKVAISRMPITPEQHSSNTQKRKEPSEKPTPAVKQQRKVAHNAIERRYRNNINERITELRLVVPALNSAKLRALAADNKRGKGNRSVAADDEPEDDDQDDVIDGIPAATKLNKATILRKATEYIIYLKAQVAKAQDEASELRRLLEGLPGGHDALRAWAIVKSSMAAAASVEATTGTEAGASPPPSSPDSVRKSSESSGPDAKRRATSSGFIGTNYDGDDDDDEDFDDDEEATHEHTPGKILGQAVAGVVGWNASATSSDSSPLPSAAAGYVDVIAVLGAGASALWVVAKIVIMVVGLLTLLFSLRSGSASSRIRLSGKQKRPAPQPAKRTSAIVKAALGVARESFNFIIAHIMGARFFAEIFFGLLPGGEEWLEEKRAAHVANVKAGLKRLNVEMTSKCLIHP